MSPSATEAGRAGGATGAEIEVRDLNVVFHRRESRHPVISNLDLSIRSGEFVVVVGRSGCGKTTLLRVIAGLLKPSSGRVSIGAKEVRGPRTDIGIVFQRPTLLPWKRVLDNVMLPFDAGVAGRSLGKSEYAERREYAHYLLSLTGLEEYATAYPAELSGGMQQRVGICRGLVTHPVALLMDEPFAALDAINRESLAVELGSICWKLGMTVLFITHSIPEALFLGDRVLVMKSGGHGFEADISVPSLRPRPLSAFSDASVAHLATEMREAIAADASSPSYSAMKK